MCGICVPILSHIPSHSLPPFPTFLLLLLPHLPHHPLHRCFTIALSHLPSTTHTTPSSLTNSLLLHYLLSLSHSPNYNFHASNGYYEYSTTPSTVFPSATEHYEWTRKGLEIWRRSEEGMRGEKAEVLHKLLQAEAVRAIMPGFEVRGGESARGEGVGLR